MRVKILLSALFLGGCQAVAHETISISANGVNCSERLYVDRANSADINVQRFGNTRVGFNASAGLAKPDPSIPLRRCAELLRIAEETARIARDKDRVDLDLAKARADEELFLIQNQNVEIEEEF